MRKSIYQDLIDNGTNVTVSMSAAELKNFVCYVISDTKKQLEEEVIADKAERLLSVQQVSEMLSVDKSTLWRWDKSSYLKPIRIGGKVRYRYSEIKELLKPEVQYARD